MGSFDPDFFADIPDYQTKVFAHSTRQICYVSQDIGWVHHAQGLLPRAGTCLRIVGPSHTALTLMIAGTFTPNRTSTHPLAPFQNQTIIVSETLFNTVTPPTGASSGFVTQVTVSIAECPFPAPPSLYMFSRNATVMDVKLINTGPILMGGFYGSALFPILPDGHFHVPIGETPDPSLKFFSINNDQITFMLNLSKTTGFQDTTNPFTLHTTSDCDYVPGNVMHTNTVGSETRMVQFAWSFTRADPVPIPLQPSPVFVVPFDTLTPTLVIRYVNTIQFYHHFNTALFNFTLLSGSLSVSRVDFIIFDQQSAPAAALENVVCPGLNSKFSTFARGDQAFVMMKTNIPHTCQTLGLFASLMSMPFFL